MRMLTILLVLVGLMSLAAMTSGVMAGANAGTLLAAAGNTPTCGAAAPTGDGWPSAATGSEAIAGRSGCRTVDRHVVVLGPPSTSVAMVSETATWLMMIGGFALLGVGLRGRRTNFAA
jgi:disulfide bond formation protein DsbB